MFITNSDLSSTPIITQPLGNTAPLESGGRLTLSVIIVSYNTREMTLKCLRTLQGELSAAMTSGDNFTRREEFSSGNDDAAHAVMRARFSAEVWLVDNASQDGTVEAVGFNFPHVNIIACDQNSGFGAANNRALNRARGEFFLLLNSDAFPCVGTVSAMIQLMRTHPKMGVLGPRLLNVDHTPQRSTFPFPTPLHCWLDNLGVAKLFNRTGRGLMMHDCDVEWVIGACMLVRREAWEMAGGFDERFFMYAEESDWQRRIRDAGWRICFTPSATVIHVGRGSSPAAGSKVERYFFESLDRYQLKHHGKVGFISVRLAMILGCSARAAGWAVLGLLHHSRRQVAWEKARFHAWLAFRQATAAPPWIATDSHREAGGCTS